MIKEIIDNFAGIESTLKREFKEVPFKMIEKDDYIELIIFVVKFKERNKGIGTSFMKRLIELANLYQKDIYLTPDDSYGEETDMNKSQLTKWYNKLGFTKKHKDDSRSKYTMCYYSKD